MGALTLSWAGAQYSRWAPKVPPPARPTAVTLRPLRPVRGSQIAPRCFLGLNDWLSQLTTTWLYILSRWKLIIPKNPPKIPQNHPK